MNLLEMFVIMMIKAQSCTSPSRTDQTGVGTSVRVQNQDRGQENKKWPTMEDSVSGDIGQLAQYDLSALWCSNGKTC